MRKSILIFIAVLAAVLIGCLIGPLSKEKKMPALSETDPEFAASWDNFINSDVKPHGRLDPATRFLLLLAAHIAAGAPQEYEILLTEALDNGAEPAAVKEVVYQAVPYLGMAKVYEFLQITNRVLAAKGIKLPLDHLGTTAADNRLEKGLAVQRAIFGGRIDDMRAAAPQDLKHIQDYLSANCFGDYYTRGGLDLKTRELLTFSLLISLGGADSQVKSHVQGNLNIGNDRETLIDAVTQLLPYIGYPRSLNAIAAINDLTFSNQGENK